MIDNIQAMSMNYACLLLSLKQEDTFYDYFLNTISHLFVIAVLQVNNKKVLKYLQSMWFVDKVPLLPPGNKGKT